MANQQYYQVPDTVSQYYPNLVDDYIRAAQAAYSPRQEAPQPTWVDYLTKGLGAVSQSLAPYFQEERQSRLAEERDTRTFERQQAAAQATEQRQRGLLEQKDAQKQMEEARQGMVGRNAMQKLMQLINAPQLTDASLGSVASGIEGMVRGGPDVQPSYPAQYEKRTNTDPMGTLMELFGSDPRTAADAVDWMAGQKNAGKDIFTNAFNPLLNKQREANIGKTEAQTGNINWMQEYRDLDQQIKMAQRDRDLARREDDLARMQRADAEIAAHRKRMDEIAAQNANTKANPPTKDSAFARDVKSAEQAVRAAYPDLETSDPAGFEILVDKTYQAEKERRRNVERESGKTYNLPGQPPVKSPITSGSRSAPTGTPFAVPGQEAPPKETPSSGGGDLVAKAIELARQRGLTPQQLAQGLAMRGLSQEQITQALKDYAGIK